MKENKYMLSARTYKFYRIIKSDPQYSEHIKKYYYNNPCYICNTTSENTAWLRNIRTHKNYLSFCGSDCIDKFLEMPYIGKPAFCDLDTCKKFHFNKKSWAFCSKECQDQVIKPYIFPKEEYITQEQYESPLVQSLIEQGKEILAKYSLAHELDTTPNKHGSCIIGNGFGFYILYKRHKHPKRHIEFSGACQCDFDELDAKSEIKKLFKEKNIPLQYFCGRMD